MKDKKQKPKIFAINKYDRGEQISRKNFLKSIGAMGAAISISSKTAFAEKMLELEKSTREPFQAHKESINALVYSPVSNILATGGYDSIKLWSIPDGTLLKTFNNNATYLSFSPDGKFIAIVFGSIIIWDLSSGKSKRIGTERKVDGVCFSPMGNSLAVANHNGVELWSLQNEKPIHFFDTKYKSMELVCFSPDGMLVIGCSKYSSFFVWNVSTGELIKEVNPGNQEVKSVCFSPDGKVLATGCKDGTISLWSSTYWDKITKLKAHNKDVKSLVFSPDGKTLISGSWDKTIKIWSMHKAILKQSIEASPFGVNSIGISPDGKYLAGASYKTLRLWELPHLDATYIIYDPEATRSTNAKKIQQMGYKKESVNCNEQIPEDTPCICNCISSIKTYHGNEQICACNTVTIAQGSPLPKGSTCSCNSVSVGTANSSGGGGGGGSYWYPN